MYFRVRKTGDKDLIVYLSKTASIENLRRIIAEKLEIQPKSQLLLYRGKEMNDKYRIIDYGVRLNDVVQLIERKAFIDDDNSKFHENEKYDTIDTKIEEKISMDNKEEEEEGKEVICKSKYYREGDLIDFIHDEYGSWYEGIIVNIVTKTNVEKAKEIADVPEEKIVFKVKMDINDYPHEPFCLKFDGIRPRSHQILKKKELNVGDIVLVNYNDKEPKEQGFWYDFLVENLDKEITGVVMAGNTVFEKSTILLSKDIMRIEKPSLIEHTKTDDANVYTKRKIVYRCDKCKDIPSKKCKDCGCKVCFSKENLNSIILCDDCDSGYHIGCLNPPLSCVPSDYDWYCPDCKTNTDEIVKPGDSLKISNKKAKKPSNKQSATSKEWGHGMACVGRSKECTIVPIHHFGPIPGIEVGTCWKFRVQVSEAGIHRQCVAGIHGRETDGAYSIILSGGYEDDLDNGNEFYYTGSGGRDLSGNKRISGQSFDQSLTNMNKALALNCNTKFDDKNGGEAEDWKAGKPVRVVRNYKLAKHSKYAPKEGNRYDGIYKVVKYYPEKGKSGFLIWRYLLRRDDPAPAPWDKNGQQLPMRYPEGYLQAQLEKKRQSSTRTALKRKNSVCTTSLDINKKPKLPPYKLDAETKTLIQEDKLNEAVWTQCKKSLTKGKENFLQDVESAFSCICCFEVVYLPVITPCKHVVCKSCIKRSFSAEIFTCPYCRFELGITFKPTVAENLSKILLKLFPGYESGR